MTTFIAAAAALSVVVLGLLLRPVLFKRDVAMPPPSLASIALAVPVTAALVYGLIGNTDALLDHPGQPAMDPQVEQIVAALAAKLEKDPDDKKGWVMLARSYKAMGRPADAERAYEKAGDFIDNDAQELANYADVVANNADGNFNGKPTQLLQKALRADPNNQMALWLSGSAAYQGGDAKTGIASWQKLLASLPADSEGARELRNVIAQAGGTAPAAPPQAAAAGASTNTTARTAATVTGTVELDPKLKAGPSDIVMVIARVPGQRMPVAVMRVQAASFPIAFTLDDSLAVAPQARISMANEVEVEARVSKSGDARPRAGDFSSDVQTVKVGAKGVNLRVANVRG